MIMGSRPDKLKQTFKRNNTSFSISITSRLKELYSLYEKDDKWKYLLKYYQYIINFLLSEIEDSRGLLLYFTMGMGKTRTAVSVALAMQNSSVIVILPKSLQDNFEKTILYVEKELGISSSHRINYISMDAYNSITQLKNISTGLNNSLIIVDEAHNLFRSIINGSTKSNAYQIYESIMNAKNVKILFLTGTPISKDPFEMVPCINMLSGFDSLPIFYDQFNILYVDEKNNDIKNKEYLANRLIGLISYATISNESKHMFPEELPTIIHKVEMGKYQYQKYLQAREQEESNKRNTEYKSTKTNPMSIPKQVNSSAYYINSRSISNYISPIDNIDSHENGPKLDLIAKHALNAKGLVMVYSQFVNTHGLKQLTIYLKKYGFIEYDENKERSLTYILYTGEVNQKYREKIINVFNCEENKYGDIIKVILISKTGAEGLNLKNVRETHQMEPYWDLSRNNQVKSRAIRYGSHMSLLEEERNVQPYLYLAIANEEVRSHIKKPEIKTIDEIFNDRAINKDNINNKFRDLLKDVSIECTFLNIRKSCYVCSPSDQLLFTDDPFLDIKITNPCITYIEEEKEAKKIILNNNEYYYTENPLIVYKYEKYLSGYIEVVDGDIIDNIKSLIK